MKYRYQEVLEYCRAHAAAWTTIIRAGAQITPDFQFIEIATELEGVKPCQPMDTWPRWARLLAASKHRRPEDRGIGDTLVHWIGDSASARFKKWYHRLAGHECGCTDRQTSLNREYPY